MSRRRILDDDEEDGSLDVENPPKFARADQNVISVFGPKLLSGKDVRESPQDVFLSGFEKTYSLTANPIRSVQVLLQAAGRLVGATDPALADYTTLPVAPADSPALGALILYNIHQLAAMTMPAAAMLADELWIHYRTSLSNYLGTDLPAFQNQLRRIDNRFETYAWGRMIKAARTLRLVAAEEVETFTKSIAASPDKENWPDVATFTDTLYWREWVDRDFVEDVARSIKESNGKSTTPESLALDRDTLLAGTTPAVSTESSRGYVEMLAIAAAEPRDLAEMLGIRTERPRAIGDPPALLIAPSAISDLIAQVTGTKAPPAKESVIASMLAVYKQLAVVAGGTDRVKLNSAYLYIFLYVWLPLRTGIGFTQQLGLFRARPISYCLVGRNGLLPLIGSPLYAHESALGNQEHVFSLMFELTKFYIALTGQELEYFPDLRTFLARTPPAGLSAWAEARHAGVATFRQAELPLLGRLFYAAQQCSAVSGKTHLYDATWLEHTLSRVTWTQRPPLLPPDQRTIYDALGLYQAAAERVNAPNADRVYAAAAAPAPTSDPEALVLDRQSIGVNYAEFGAPGIVSVVESLLVDPGRLPTLLILIGPALGRLPAMLAYLHPWLWCACVPVMAVSKTAANGLTPCATDWITPIADEMALVTGDDSLRQRVFVLHDFPLSENYRRGNDLFTHALTHVSEDVEIQQTFIVANSYNATVQFDVPAPLFALQVEHLLTSISKKTALIGALTTFHRAAAQPIPISASALPLAPLFARHGIQDDAVYYQGAAPLGEIGTLALPNVRERQRRAALTRALGPGGPVNSLYSELREVLTDTAAMLDAQSLAVNPILQEFVDKQLIHIAVLAASLDRLRTEGVIQQTPPLDLIAQVDAVIAMARRVLPNKDFLAAAEAQLRQSVRPGSIAGSGMSVLGELLVALERRGEAASPMGLPRVSLDTTGQTVKVRVTTRLLPVKLALDRLNSATVDGRQCLLVLADWSTALFALVDACSKDFTEQYYHYKPANDSTAVLQAHEANVHSMWPLVVACLRELVLSGDDAIEEHESLQAAYGPALIYAQLINNTLVFAQRIVEAFQTDMRAGRAVEFRHQELPFLAWQALEHGVEQQTVARLSELLFAQNGWILPVLSGVTHDTTNGSVSLRTYNSLAARQVAELLLASAQWKAYSDDMADEEKRLITAVGHADLRGVRAAQFVGEEAKANVLKLQQVRSERQQFERIVDSFFTLAETFRTQASASRLPTHFFVESRPEFTADLSVVEERLRPALQEAVRKISARASAARTAAVDIQRPLYVDVLSGLEDLYQKLSYAYVTGGFGAVFDALAVSEARREMMQDVNEEAMRTEDIWQVEINFDGTEPELSAAFPAASAQAIRDWLAAGNKRIKVFSLPDEELGLLAIDETVRDPEANAVLSQRLYIVIVPKGRGQGPDLAQAAWLHGYLAADRLRMLRRVKEDTEALREHWTTVQRVVGDGIDIATNLDALRKFWRAVLADPIVQNESTRGTIAALSTESDDWWLAKTLLRAQEPWPQPPPAIAEYLNGTTVASAIEDNSFDNKRLLSDMLYTAYTNLKPDKAGTPEYAKWRRYLMTPVPALEEIGDAPWQMSPIHLDAVVPPADRLQVSGDFTEHMRRAVSTDSVFRNLLLSTMAGNIDETQHATIISKSTAENQVLMLTFANAYKAQDPRAKEWWDAMLHHRDTSTSLELLDLEKPDDKAVTENWIKSTLWTSLPPEVVGRILEVDPVTHEHESVATFVRMIAYGRSTDGQGKDFSHQLVQQLGQVTVRTNANAVKLGIATPDDPTLRLPTLEQLKLALKSKAESFIVERRIVAAAQRRIWSGALGRLLDTLQDRGAPHIVTGWLRSRASSWSQRLRMLDPALSAHEMWPTVLTSLSAELPDVSTLKSRLQPASALALSAKQIEAKYKVYRTSIQAATVSTVETRRRAATLLATVLKDVADDSTLVQAYTGEAGQVMSMLRLVLATDSAQSKLKSAADRLASEAALEREEKTETMPPALGLFTNRFQDPVLRFGEKVIDKKDCDQLATTLAEGLITSLEQLSPTKQQQGEGLLLATTATVLSRLVQFADAERNRTAPRVSSHDETSVAKFVRAVKFNRNNPDAVRTLIAKRLIDDSLLYSDLDSVKPA